ncbi:unnamed protein product [Miscanthus lutarioriparius]|uniref:Uncharacterized protein n=1 Tax=Miscanthus lutarioriparius TaxID=422564 RepID=A0A811PSA1_9POAL|nr:unnamed protein product [Miscanthus lutarioriparius]
MAHTAVARDGRGGAPGACGTEANGIGAGAGTQPRPESALVDPAWPEASRAGASRRPRLSDPTGILEPLPSQDSAATNMNANLNFKQMKSAILEHFPLTYLCNILTFSVIFALWVLPLALDQQEEAHYPRGRGYLFSLCSRRSDCSDWLSELLRKFVVAEGGDDADAPTSLFTFRSDANA